MVNEHYSLSEGPIVVVDFAVVHPILPLGISISHGSINKFYVTYHLSYKRLWTLGSSEAYPIFDHKRPKNKILL